MLGVLPVESDWRSLWDELKRLNRGVKCATSTLDGHSKNADIVEHLATKYRALFSSQTTTEARLNDIRHVIQDKVTCEGNAFVVTVTEVCGMTSKLKINKSDGLTGSSSDHFVYAPHRFAVLFTMLINVMLVHGYMPDDMLAFVLVPIPKDPRSSLTNSGNYRAIALYFSMGKIVDMLISQWRSQGGGQGGHGPPQTFGKFFFLQLISGNLEVTRKCAKKLPEVR